MKKSSKMKYVPIASSDIAQGEILLPGRHACNCEASKHPLINNCLSCGRIVCEQERSGPCFTCGSLVSDIHCLKNILVFSIYTLYCVYVFYKCNSKFNCF